MAQLMAQQQQEALVKLMQQQAGMTRRARRLHVSNLPPGMTPEALKELFNTLMLATKIVQNDEQCINAVQMPENKFAEGSSVKFCFLEFRSVFECTAALTVLNGMDLLGNSLKVMRPNDYQPVTPDLERVMVAPHIGATVKKGAY